MVRLTVFPPAKWEQFLKHLANDHEIDLNTVVSELCEWAFSDSESKEQFKVWLDEAYPQKREAEDEARAAGEETVRKKNLKRNPTNTDHEIKRRALKQKILGKWSKLLNFAILTSFWKA